MSTRTLSTLRDMLCDELDEIAKKPEMSAGDLETVHKLTDTIKNIDKIEMLQDGGYSQADGWDEMMPQGGGYSGRRRDAMGRYSRNNSYRQGGRRYSRGGGLLEQVEMLEDEAETPEEKELLQKFKRQLRDMR